MVQFPCSCYPIIYLLKYCHYLCFPPSPTTTSTRWLARAGVVLSPGSVTGHLCRQQLDNLDHLSPLPFFSYAEQTFVTAVFVLTHNGSDSDARNKTAGDNGWQAHERTRVMIGNDDERRGGMMMIIGSRKALIGSSELEIGGTHMLHLIEGHYFA